MEPGGAIHREQQHGQSAWQRWVPGIAVLRQYELRWLGHDAAAGLALSVVLVPVGLAYAVASGVPGVCGLYATIAGLLAYALFGPSRILVLGPDSSLSALILAAVLPLSAGDPQRVIALAGLLAVISGTFCMLAGLLRLGFVTELLSKPIRHGYMNGIALTVIGGQLPALCGFSVHGDGLLQELHLFVAALLDGRINPTALFIGSITLLVILLTRRNPRIPGMLIGVAGATAAVSLLDLAAGSGVPVLGALPQGLPSFSLPSMDYRDASALLLAGLAVALVSFADTSVLSRTYAARGAVPVDPNREMIGLGMANLAAGFLQGFPLSASASRTPVAEAAGATTQLTSVVGALAVAALLLLAPNLLRNLPGTALAAVVISAAFGLIEISDLRRIYRIQRWEFWLSMGCFIGVALLGVIPGIAMAVGVAIGEFLWDGWRPHSAILGRIDGLKGYHDITRHPDAKLIPGLVLFRWDAPLFFANAEFFRKRARDAIASAPVAARRLVIAAEPVTSIDVTAADMLAELQGSLRRDGIELCFAELKDPVRDKLQRFGLLSMLPEGSLFPTIGEAVAKYLVDSQVQWLDWEDRPPLQSPEPASSPAKSTGT